MLRPSCPVRWFAALALALALAGPARAQDAPAAPPDTLAPPPPEETPPPSPPVRVPAPAPTPAPPPVAPAPSAAGEDLYAYPALFDLRTRDEIQRDVDLQAHVRAAARRLMVDARALQTRRKYDADIKKTEIDAAKKRIDLAKKEKRDADARALDGDKKRLEVQKDYLEKLRDAAGAEADFQQAVMDYADARDAVSRAEQATMALGDFDRAEVRATPAVRTAQARWNDALKARASAGAAVADREKTLSDRRRAAMDAWLRLSPRG